MFPKRVHLDRLPLDGSGRLCCGGIKSLHEFGAKGADKHCVFAIFDAFQRTINIPGMMISRMGGRPGEQVQYKSHVSGSYDAFLNIAVILGLYFSQFVCPAYHAQNVAVSSFLMNGLEDCAYFPHLQRS